VVTSAQFMLDSESKLREAIQKMLEPKQEEPAAMPAKEEKLDDLFK
jgi:Cu(I)/Ag(I) efflux system membrane fusion protein/cobalt-zinc-cadmium efflux system membrane fusion protein